MDQLQKAQKHFKPRARIMELLGDQLIKSHTLALFELIKNSYDADSGEVKLTLLNIDDKKNGLIEIQDNGFGMDFDTVINVWMEPASGHQGEKRLNNEFTPKGRLAVGEKGVGRFAVHRLGTQVSVVTRAKNRPEVVVNIDWEALAKHKYLEDAFIEIKERVPELFIGKNHGTRITISGLKEVWKRGDVRRLYRSVLGMTSGVVFDKKNKNDLPEKTDFAVNFEMLPEQNWLDGMFDPATARDQAMFDFEFQITDEGLKYQYKFIPLPGMANDYPNLIIPRQESINRGYSEFFVKRPPGEDGWAKRKDRNERPLLGRDGLGIGPISGRILGFDLDKEIKSRYLKDFGGLSEFLKDQGGIRVYRDGLRVYNYGEPGDDWLNLDHRRIQRPTKKLSNQLIMGEIFIDHAESIALKEKTNREGFVENQAYEELKYAMLCALTDFEAERNKDKERLRDILELPPGTKDKKIKRKKSTEELLTELKQAVLEKNLEKDIGDLVDSVESAYKETRDAMLSAVGSGLGLVTVFHELERGIRNLNDAISKDIPTSKLKEMSKGLISLLRGAMYMVSRSSMEKIKASKLVEYALASQELRFTFHKIKVRNGFEINPNADFEIHGVRRMLTATLVNLIDNAIHWVRQNDMDDKQIWIGPSHDLEAPSIVIADNGPGFIDDPSDIVQPFFSRKSDGMGIGLYYADMVMNSHNARLAFPDRGAVDIPKVCDGAVIAMIFGK